MRQKNEKKYKKWKAKKNVKTCPLCSREIEKTVGCNHITCLCGSHRCWICGKDGDVNGNKFD